MNAVAIILRDERISIGFLISLSWSVIYSHARAEITAKLEDDGRDRKARSSFSYDGEECSEC
jgi:hypothetical protein